VSRYILTDTCPRPRNLVSKLQGVSSRIQDTTQYVRNAAEELARDEVSLTVLTEQILRELRLRINDEDTRLPSANVNAARLDDLDSEEENSLLTRKFLTLSFDAETS
jgi:hypothetical protein